MRKGFTLLELLIIIGIIGIMTTVAVLSIFRGQDAARLRGSVRDVFATVRLARSTALVTQKPCIVTFSTKATEDGSQSKAQITSARLLKSSGGVMARSLDGEWMRLGGEEEEPVADRTDGETPASSEGGESVEEILFAPIADEILKDVCIKVVLDSDDEVDFGGEVNEAKRAMISTFSNVDFLLGSYQKERERQAKAEQAAQETEPEPSAKKSLTETENEERSLVWQVNGRCDPHRIYIYSHGLNPMDGWVIRVDRFGSAKVYAPGEEEK